MQNRYQNPDKTLLRKQTGFTLVELMVTIVIVIALAAMAFAFTGRALNKAQKVATMQQMRDLALGIDAYTVDYNRPPVPEPELSEGRDVIYGNQGKVGDYGTEILLAALMEIDSSSPGEQLGYAEEMNPKGGVYFTPELKETKKEGVYRKDGRMYDVWGNEIMVAVNMTTRGGDKLIETRGAAEWRDKEPRHQPYILWSYGKDGDKAKALGGSDDVALGF